MSCTPAAARGNYMVTDTQTNPGARCYYPGVNQSNNDLSKIKIHSPLMYAKSGTQWVGWQYSIQHGDAPAQMPRGPLTTRARS